MLILSLCFFAFLAGFVDAMVGGGGLIQLPAFLLLQPQLTLVETLATNKTASFLGTSVAAVSYVRKISMNWQLMSFGMFGAFMGAFSGALLVSHVTKKQFMPFMIGALLLVLLYTLMKKDFGLQEQTKNRTPMQWIIFALLIGLIIGFYDGLIGPGTGSFFIFGFVVLFGLPFLSAAANAKVLNCVTNLGALLLFCWQGNIIWGTALPVGLANMLGNYCGSKLALKKGSGFIRIFFLVVVTALIARLTYQWLYA